MRRGVVVTGGSRGIGLATARLFQQSDYEVISLSRSAPPTSVGAHLAADITDLTSVERAAEILLEQATRWDRTVLIHNAAVHRHDTVRNLSARELLAVLSANLAAPQALNKALVPAMKPGSSILYIGSTLAEKAVAGAASYIASKHAMVGLVKTVGAHYAKQGSRINGIAPVATFTDFVKTAVPWQ